MQWLKNGGKDYLIKIAKNLETEFKSRGLIDGFELKMFLEGEHICKAEDEGFADEELVPEGVVDYSIDWYGREGAPLIFDLLECVCDYHGIQRVIDKKIYMRRAFVSLEHAKKVLSDVKEVSPYLIANEGKDLDLRKYLHKDEIPKSRILGG